MSPWNSYSHSLVEFENVPFSAQSNIQFTVRKALSTSILELWIVVGILGILSFVDVHHPSPGRQATLTLLPSVPGDASVFALQRELGRQSGIPGRRVPTL